MWIGGFGWLIGFSLVMIPDTLLFWRPIAGGAVLTLAGVLVIERAALRAPRYLAGLIALFVAVAGAYWIAVCEPAVAAAPEVVARLKRLRASTHVPPAFVWVAGVVGVIQVLWAWRRSRSEPPDVAPHFLDWL
jgi:hypothetical protein